MEIVNYLNVGECVTIGTDPTYVDVLGVNMKEKTLLVNCSDGLVWFEFGQVTGRKVFGNLVYERRTEVERILKCLKYAYPEGTEIKLIEMNDKYSSGMVSGLKGKVTFIDDAGTIHVSWENGSGLGLVFGEDKFAKVW